MMTTDKKNIEERVVSLRETFERCFKMNLAVSQMMKNLEREIAELEKEISSDKTKNESEKYDKFKEEKNSKDLSRRQIKTFSAGTSNNSSRPQIDYDLSKKDTAKTRPLYSQRTAISNRIEPRTDFIAEYNLILNETNGYQKKTAKENFVAKYKVRAFNCVNFNERMNQPSLKPNFFEVESIQEGEYWAIPVGGNTFKVVPNINSYNENYHVARAMGEVFDSNFVSATYNKIQIDVAAEFNFSGQNWTLVKKGKLILG